MKKIASASSLVHFIILFFVLTLSLYIVVGFLTEFRISAGIITVIFLMFVAKLGSSNNVIYRSATVLVFFVGLSPIYLVLRGFVSRSHLNVLDFPLYFFSFAVLTTVYMYLKNSKNINQLKIFNFSSFSVVCSSLLSLFTLVFFQIVLIKRSVGDAVAWIASGDSKNHLVNAVDIIRYGFLDPATFLTQPVSSPTLLSLFLAQDGQNINQLNELMKHQLLTYSFFWVFLIGILGITISASGETFWNFTNKERKKFPILLAGLLSTVAFLSFFIGPATWDGFFTAIFGISTVVMMTNWFAIVVQNETFSKHQIFIGFLFFVSSLMAWMFIVPLTALLLFAGLIIQVSKTRLNPSLQVVTWLLVTIFLGAIIQFSGIGQDFIYKAKVALSAQGAVNVSNPDLYLALILIFVVLGTAFLPIQKNLSNFFFCISGFHFVALFGFKFFSNLGVFGWNYYLLKYQWIMVSSLFILLVAFTIVVFFRVINAKYIGKISVAAFLVLIAYLFSESLIPINKVWQKVNNGWQNPRNSMMNLVLEQNIDRKNPTLFFQYGYAGDARLGNFWLSAFVDPIEPLKGWNYTIDTDGNPQQLCDVNAYYPSVTVITSSTSLGKELKELCPNEPFQIQIQEN